MRQTFYETNYKTTKSFFSNRPTSSKLTGQALTDGNILSNIDNISINELKERLIVAETIMKKLYARNKDLETGVQKAQLKIKGQTQESFFNKENEEGVEIEIGCSNCSKLQTREQNLINEIEKKNKYIIDLEEKVAQKFEIDINSYQS